MNLLINRLFLIGMTIGLLALGGGRLAAVDNLQVNVTLTIAASISVTWCDNSGANDTDSARSWSIGAAALSQVYDTDPAQNGGNGGYWATGVAGTPTNDSGLPTLTYIQNLSNTSIDIDLSCANSTPSNWAKTGVGANAFLMEASVNNGGSWISLAAGAGANAYTNVLNNATTTNPLLLRLSTPSSITIGGGIAQTIVVTATASVAN